MATGRLMGWASCGALALWVLAGCGGGLSQAPKTTPVAPVAAAAAKQIQITNVQVSGTGDVVQVTVSTSAKAAYSLVRQSAPARLFLQLSGTRLSGPAQSVTVDRGAVSVVKSAGTPGADATVEVFLSGEALYEIEGRGNSIVLNISPKAPVPAPAPAEKPAASAEAVKAEQPVTVVAVVPPPVVTIAAEEPAPVVAAPSARAAAVPSGPRALTAIDVQKQTDGLVVALQGNGPLAYESFLVEGRSLVVDLAGANNQVKSMKRKVDDAWVSQIRIGDHDQPKRFVRVVFDLKKVGEHRVEAVGDRIVVSFGAPALAPPAAAPAPAAPAAPAEGTVSALNRVGPVSCRATEAGGARLEIRTAVKADFAVIDSNDPAKVIIEIAKARVSDKDAQSLDLASQGLDVVKVTVFPYAKGDDRLVRVIAQLRRPLSFRTSGEDGRIVVEFDKPGAVAPASGQGAAAAPVPAAPATAATPAPAPAAKPAPVVVKAPVAAPAAAPAPAAQAAEVPAAAVSPFSGRRLSLDFKDADVNDILRLISEVSGLNFVAGPEVKGSVSIKLTDVPWDQALDLILKTNVPQLEQVRESENIVRITTTDKLMDEEQRHRRVDEDKKKTVDAQKALEPVFSKTFAISYIESGKMNDFVTKLDKFKSSQGIIQFDERTKHIIVWDTADKLKELEQVILTWDAPTPAVLVEARIVYVTSGFGQSIGVQWNANGIKDPAHGNGTPYAFPNSVSMGGQQIDAAKGSMPTNYLVNLPAAAATGGIGFSLGHIANTLSLDMRLSAGESMSKVKILSNPKILVIQNEQAVINLGSQLPIPKTDSEGNRTVEWKDVGITLTVKPQITNDKRVFMDIKVEKSSKGENVQTTEGTMFSIDRAGAESKVLIADGETTVIGGIFEQVDDNGSSAIPGLGKIPILGWLFKNKSDSQSRRELMIFITPKIVVM